MFPLKTFQTKILPSLSALNNNVFPLLTAMSFISQVCPIKVLRILPLEKYHNLIDISFEEV
jgi:hypothetical protein